MWICFSFIFSQETQILQPHKIKFQIQLSSVLKKSATRIQWSKCIYSSIKCLLSDFHCILRFPFCGENEKKKHEWIPCNFFVCSITESEFKSIENRIINFFSQVLSISSPTPHSRSIFWFASLDYTYIRRI